MLCFRFSLLLSSSLPSVYHFFSILLFDVHSKNWNQYQSNCEVITIIVTVHRLHPFVLWQAMQLLHGLKKHVSPSQIYTETTVIVNILFRLLSRARALFSNALKVICTVTLKNSHLKKVTKNEKQKQQKTKS